MDHKTRDFLVRQQTHSLTRSMLTWPSLDWSTLGERLLPLIAEAPKVARPAMDLLAERFRNTRARIAAVTDRIEATGKVEPPARRLTTISEVRVLSSSAFAGAKPALDNCRTRRGCAAWPGLTRARIPVGVSNGSAEYPKQATVGSTGQHTACPKVLAGVWKPSVFRGRVLRRRATSSSSLWVYADRSGPFAKYCQQASGVFVAAALPGALRITEVNDDIRRDCYRAVISQFGPPIPCRRGHHGAAGAAPGRSTRRRCYRCLCRRPSQVRQFASCV